MKAQFVTILKYVLIKKIAKKNRISTDYFLYIFAAFFKTVIHRYLRFRIRRFHPLLPLSSF